jgi:hypothetical protein
MRPCIMVSMRLKGRWGMTERKKATGKLDTLTGEFSKLSGEKKENVLKIVRRLLELQSFAIKVDMAIKWDK